MKKLLVITTVFLVLFIGLSPVLGEESITGTLSGYGKNFIVVDGKKVELCEDYRIYDSAAPDEETVIDGLVAVETVSVTLENGCAVEVRAITVRN
ncbi:MAG TPA: hypothetical protein ENJ04_04330 [Nitrospirae bacterium]|nr:hypothetical protein [Nitrospirota bacterium]